MRTNQPTTPKSVLQTIQQLSGDDKQQLAEVRAAYTASHGLLEKLKSMGRSWSRPEEKDTQDHTAFHLAVKMGKPAITQYLLEEGVSIDSKNNDDETPLITAVKLEDEKARVSIVQQIMTTAAKTLSYAHADKVVSPIGRYVSHSPKGEMQNSAACIAAYKGCIGSIEAILQQTVNATVKIDYQFLNLDTTNHTPEQDIKFNQWIKSKIKEKKDFHVPELLLQQTILDDKDSRITSFANFFYCPALLIACWRDYSEIVALILLKSYQHYSGFLNSTLIYQQGFRTQFEMLLENHAVFLEKYKGLIEILRDYVYVDYTTDKKELTVKPDREQAVMAYAKQMKTVVLPTSHIAVADSSANCAAIDAKTTFAPSYASMQHKTVHNYFDYCRRKKIQADPNEFKKIYTKNDLFLKNGVGETILMDATASGWESIAVLILQEIKTHGAMHVLNYLNSNNLDVLMLASCRGLSIITYAAIQAGANIHNLPNHRTETTNLFSEIDSLIKDNKKPNQKFFQAWRKRNNWNTYPRVDGQVMPRHFFKNLGGGFGTSVFLFSDTISKALLLACFFEKQNTAKILLENKADPTYAYDFCMRKAYSEEFSAWFLEQPEVKKLIQTSINITDTKKDEKNTLNSTPTPTTRKPIDKPKTILQVMQKRIDDKKINHVDTCAFDSVAIGNEDTLNDRDDDGNTAAHLAAFHDDRQAINWLNQEKADFNIKNKQDQTPLAIAIEKEHVQFILLLLKYRRVDIEAYDKNGRTPLINVIDSNLSLKMKLDIVNEILKIVDTWRLASNKRAYISYYPAKPTYRVQESAICLAAYHRHDEIVRILVEHNSKPGINYYNGGCIEVLTAFEHWLATHIDQKEFHTTDYFRYFIKSDDACLKLAKRNVNYYGASDFCPAFIIACFRDAANIVVYLAEYAMREIAQEYYKDLAFLEKYNSVFKFFEIRSQVIAAGNKYTAEQKSDAATHLKVAERDGFHFDTRWYKYFGLTKEPSEGQPMPMDVKIGTPGIPSAPSEINTNVAPAAPVGALPPVASAPIIEAPGGPQLNATSQQTTPALNVERPNDLMSSICSQSPLSVSAATVVAPDDKSSRIDAKDTTITIATAIEKPKSSSAAILLATSAAADNATVVVVKASSDEGISSATQQPNSVLESLKPQLETMSFPELIALQQLITETLHARYTAATSVASFSFMSSSSDEGCPVLAPSRTSAQSVSTSLLP